MASSHPVTLQSTIKESKLSYEKLIGYGGGGEVYRATWKSKSLGKIPVAAKKIPILEGSSSNVELGNEITFLQQLDHPNIIKYFGHVVTKDHVIIVMEYAEKGSMYDYMKDKKGLPPELKSKWALQGAKGIKYLQEKQVLHRDIKSPNFLITADDNLKICDFGIAKELISTTTATSDKGTVRWLAPEIFKDQTLSLKADIFAFGIVLWELETCEIPYKDVWEQRIQWVVGLGQRPEIPTSCPAFLSDLMQRCWDGNRKNRPTVDEIIQQLESGFLQWRFTHIIDTSAGYVDECNWISENHLAVCRTGRVAVYEVNRATSHLAYTLRSAEWKGREVRGAVMSEALQDSILVICEDQPFLYQYPAHEASHEIKKYNIQSKDSNNPWCLAANASVVIINMFSLFNSFRVYSLPDFTYQCHVETSFRPQDLSIATHHLLLMGKHEMIVKPTGALFQTVSAMIPPHGWTFRSVSCRNEATEIYAGCRHSNGNDRVYKYTWNGSGKPSYVNTGCVVDNLGYVGSGYSISVTSGGLMAVGQTMGNISMYSLE